MTWMAWRNVSTESVRFVALNGITAVHIIAWQHSKIEIDSPATSWVCMMLMRSRGHYLLMMLKMNSVANVKKKLTRKSNVIKNQTKKSVQFKLNKRQAMQIIIARNQKFIYLLYLSIATPNWLLIEFPTATATTTTVTAALLTKTKFK